MLSLKRLSRKSGALGSIFLRFKTGPRRTEGRTVRARFVRILRDFRSDQSGAILILVAFVLPILIGMVGLGVETAWWYYSKRTLQSAADSAAIAAAYELKRNPAISDDDLMDFVQDEASRLGYSPGTASFTLATPPNEDVNYLGPFGDDTSAVYVTITQAKDTMFAAMVGLNGLNIFASAVATEVESMGDDSCILGLRTDGTSIHFSGDANSTIIGCVPTANGDLVAQGSSVVIAECLLAVGDYIDRGNAVDLQLEGCTDPLANQGDDKIVTDPYGNVRAPSNLPCDAGLTHMDGAEGEDPVVVSPGVYCADGNGEIGIQNNTTFTPGVYYFNGTSLRINADTVLTGGPVIFVFTERDGRTGGGDITMNGTADISLYAPDIDDMATSNFPSLLTGTGIDGTDLEAADWAGMFIHSDVVGATVMINGTSNSVMTGTIHTPYSEVTMSGDSDVGSDTSCLQVIAYTVTITGGQDFTTEGCNDSVQTANSGTKWAGLVQ